MPPQLPRENYSLTSSIYPDMKLSESVPSITAVVFTQYWEFRFTVIIQKPVFKDFQGEGDQTFHLLTFRWRLYDTKNSLAVTVVV